MRWLGALPLFLVLPLSAPAAEGRDPAVRELRDLAYVTGPEADAKRHLLDLYLPADREKFPVALFVHGGGWMLGDKDFFGHGPALGRHFARQGIGVVMPSYRLSPKVKHPGHVEDVARALAWTVKNLPGHGGDLDRLFLVGHSAGGHLVTLLATDPSYLKAVGLKPSVLKGVVSVSGVYQPPELAFGFGVAGASSPLALRINPFTAVFGDDPKEQKAAFPLAHVRAGLSPFLLINAESDLPSLPAMARDFAAALRRAGNKVRTLHVPARNHDSVLFEAVTPEDPVSRAVTDFVLTP